MAILLTDEDLYMLGMKDCRFAVHSQFMWEMEQPLEPRSEA